MWMIFCTRTNHCQNEHDFKYVIIRSFITCYWGCKLFGYFHFCPKSQTEPILRFWQIPKPKPTRWMPVSAQVGPVAVSKLLAAAQQRWRGEASGSSQRGMHGNTTTTSSTIQQQHGERLKIPNSKFIVEREKKLKSKPTTTISMDLRRERFRLCWR